LVCRLPSDVQDESIPLVLGGGDVMVAARTGSGKTGAFGLPAVQLAFEIRQAQLAASAAKHEAASAAGAAASSSGKGKAAGKASAAAGPAPVAAKKGLPAAKLASENRSAWIAVHPSGMLVQSTNPKAWGGVRGNVGAFASLFERAMAT
jgi:ATP-dependent RNA helicase DDX1